MERTYCGPTTDCGISRAAEHMYRPESPVRSTLAPKSEFDSNTFNSFTGVANQ